MRRGNVYYLPNRSIGGGEPLRQSDGSNRLLKHVVCAVGATLLTGVVACVALVFVKVKAPARPPLTGSFSTLKGKHACWTLPDLSELCLNTGSTVRYAFTQTSRNLEVLSGEATFTVHPDNRPFEVLSGRFLVRDISTRFDVYRHGQLTTLTVIDGRVEAKAPINQQTHQKFDLAQPDADWNGAPQFHQLQQVEFDESTGTLRERQALTPRGLSQALAWQYGHIDPAGRSLSEVLEEFGRYQSIEKFSIPDEELRRFRVPDGVLVATDLTNFLEMLQNVYGIRHTLTRTLDGETEITLSRPQSAAGHKPRK